MQICLAQHSNGPILGGPEGARKNNATFKACVRSCYQRLHEVVRLMEAMRRRLSDSKVTTERVFDEYKKNLTNMDTTNEGAISHGFLKVARTIAKRMLAVPEIADIISRRTVSLLHPSPPSGITQGCKR